MKNKIFNYIKENRIITILLIFLMLVLVIILTCFNHTSKFNKSINNPYDIAISSTDNFVFLGDSITEGYPLEELYDDMPVINSGISGYQTTDILANLDKMVYIYNPTKVFLLIGTNDLGVGKDKKKVVSNIKLIIKKINNKKPKCKIYLESIYPINNSDDDKINHETVGVRTNKQIKEVNKSLKEYAKETDNVTYIDVYTELLDTNKKELALKYTKEGLHITDMGYLKITKILLPYFND